MARTKKPRLRVRSTWDIMVEAVERGIDYGWMRAHKHVDTPTERQIKDALQQGLELEMAEAFDFDFPADEND